MDIGTRELRQRLADILDRVERGERVRIVRKGRPAAELRPVESTERGLPDLSTFRAGIRAKGAPTSSQVVAERRKSRG